ncbi:hypothetical protein [Paenibacillus nasutitermitis]|uniref:DUF4432 family protein n=1 Tax=Paenibacillus nasutitermitis TaxID=1652958 RepID=A0A916ZDC3_9BACL|nr:hypothetical protein [Paenibacillus nasutitermitis]GGD90289.1 hypothetical protein GCM10010911_56180 [Paenibacillus nasutitermitis]
MDRNYGCRIKQDLMYKGYETVVMENERFRLTILPGKGTDMVELLHKPTDTDFIWFTRLGLRRREPAFSDFQAQYEGGWQEILPHLSGRHEYKGTPMETYGEASLTSWSYQVMEDTPEVISVMFSNSLRTLPLTVEKTITMRSGQAGFRIEETLSNSSPAVVHADWGHHITFGTPFLKPGTMIHLPDGSGEAYCVPEQGSLGGFEVLKAVHNQYKLTGPDGIGAEVGWNREVWPYVWFWRDFGGERVPPYYGCHFNVGLELFSSPPAASLEESEKRGTAIRLEPYGSLKSDLSFKVIEV